MTVRIDTSGLPPRMARKVRSIVRGQRWYPAARWVLGSVAVFDVVEGAVYGPAWGAAAAGVAGPVGIWMLLRLQRLAGELEQLLASPVEGTER